MFAGEYLCKLDEKGRFLVPSPIRERIDQDGAGVVFLKGPEESLLLYSTNECGRCWNVPKPSWMKSRVGCSCITSCRRRGPRISIRLVAC